MKKALLILLTLFTVVIGFSQTFTDANFIEYTVTPNTTTVEVTGYDFVNGGANVAIPATATYNSTTYDVTSIKFLAFSNKGISSVIIPNSVLIIGTGAFNGNILLNATIGNSVISIGNSAFFNNQLTNITIPNSVTSIGNNAFQGNALTTATIGNSVTSIGNWAFQGNSLTSITIPDGVTSIGETVFIGNPLACVISEATTPPTITTSNGTADTFAPNRGSINLSIPLGTASAYVAAQWTGFGNISEVLNDTFVVDNITYQINPMSNNEVTIIDYNTAGGTIVNIPETVSSGCTEFSVTAIGNAAFQSNNLTSVTIPASIISIGDEAFRSNQFTAGITIPVGVTSIGDSAFRFCQLPSVVISNTVTTIGDEAFFNNQLTSVTFPNSVTSIGNYAFQVNQLTDIFTENETPPTITTGIDDTFGTVQQRGGIHLHIPAGKMGAYVTDVGALWTDFNPVTEDVLSAPNFQLANSVKIVRTTDELKIISSSNAKLKNYTIYSLTGSKVKKGIEKSIAIDTLSKGIYILELNFDTGKLVKKFAK